MTELDRYSKDGVSSPFAPWRELAACRDTPTGIFFPRGNGYPTARKICSECPVSDECLEAALVEEEGVAPVLVHGMRGGLTPNERIELAAFRAELDEVDS